MDRIALLQLGRDRRNDLPRLVRTGEEMSVLPAVMVVMMVAFRLVPVIVLRFMLVFGVVLVMLVMIVVIVFPVVIVLRFVLAVVVIVVSADHFDPGAGVDHHDTLVRTQSRLADMVVEACAVLEEQKGLAGGGDLHEVVCRQDVVVGASGIRRGQQLRFDPGPVQDFPGQDPDRVRGRGDAVTGLLSLRDGADPAGQKIQHGAESDKRNQKSNGKVFHSFKTPFCLASENSISLIKK